MKTYSPKKSDIKHEWYVVDVKGKTLGKVATKIADILRGKNKPIFSPHLDCGDFVIAINAKEIKLTGNKLTDKVYQHHTRYPNGLRTYSAQELLNDRPEEVLFQAVAGMIPHTKLKKDILKKFKVFPGSEHPHTAQTPKTLEL
ncbi:MAG TPA: 50S ribosomal protein L13 [Candidatus Gracilibacteria bacterium]|nr:50S ribosomal protein L13 [Candidatus Gracilibacteria bacterium]HRY91241.1 50S ribosomal protein L13 [Candidatus Gracilibacteria bacterium]